MRHRVLLCAASDHAHIHTQHTEVGLSSPADRYQHIPTFRCFPDQLIGMLIDECESESYRFKMTKLCCSQLEQTCMENHPYFSLKSCFHLLRASCTLPSAADDSQPREAELISCFRISDLPTVKAEFLLTSLKLDELFPLS